ncbi:MAG: AraC family transcriptional regulator [Bauldia litoralis]
MPPWFESVLDLLRGAGIGLLILAAVLLIRDYRHTVAGRLGAVFVLSVVAYIVCPLMVVRWHIAWWGLPVYLVCFTIAGWFWLFARAWFVDDFRLRWWHGLLILGLLVVYGWRFIFPPGGVLPHSGLPTDTAIHLLSRAVAIAVVIAALGQAMVGRGEDLVESRRRLRAWFVFVIGGHMALVVAAEVSVPDARRLPVAEMVNLIAIALEAGAFVVFAVRMRGELFAAAALAPIARPSTAPSRRAGDPDADLAAAILRHFEGEEGYRRSGLTIGGLAETLAVPEYRLRRAINRRLGYRNFPQFLNAYRVEAAQAWLRDPDKARLPILTVALDLGYNSVGPFNRAFKEATGMTPAEYRAAGSDHPAGPPTGNSIADS